MDAEQLLRRLLIEWEKTDGYTISHEMEDLFVEAEALIKKSDQI